MGKVAAAISILLLPFLLHAQPVKESREDSLSSQWIFSIWGDYIIIPEESNILNPTFYADHKALHLESRYNYEDRNTASVWGGWRLQTGNKIKLAFIPMAAIVFGQTNGIAPGFELEVKYKKTDFYSETEYLFDFSGKENNFAYTYDELGIRPIKPLRVGFTGQRTRLYKTSLETRRGIFAEYYFGRFRTGIYSYNSFSDNYLYIVSFSVDL